MASLHSAAMRIGLGIASGLTRLATLLGLAGCAASNVAAGGESQSAVLPQALRTEAAVRPITGAVADYDSLLAQIGGARFVALGEMTHGTDEFYRERARVTERLIGERGFGAVAIEADWPETERINRYVRGVGSDRTAEQALANYTRFPRWMWRNEAFREFIERLRISNAALPPDRRAGVYGMDVYNLFGAADAVIAYATHAAPAEADHVRSAYRCFEKYRPETHRYGQAARRPGRSCENEAATVLRILRSLPRPGNSSRREEHFSAVRSAASVAGAEEYFRRVYVGSMAWNARDRRMAATIGEIADHVAQSSGSLGKVVVWAHNSHVGDARATEVQLRGELNLGQLLRQHGETYLVGFLTYTGTVMAAREWDAPGHVFELRPALPASHSGHLHAAGLGRALLFPGAAGPALAGTRPERAVGVVYARDTERISHYFQADLARQFDAVIYLDRTRAVAPLR